jgi:hypothetical protein
MFSINVLIAGVLKFLQGLGRFGVRVVALPVLLSLALPVTAQTSNDGVLTIVQPGQEKPALYDLLALQALPKTQIETTTQWTEGVQVFEGVEAQALLSALNITEGTMTATAIDGYMIEIPVKDLQTSGPMFAYLMNGAPMAVDDKGPIWLVYPYDKGPEFQTEEAISRSVWQLNRLEFIP